MAKKMHIFGNTLFVECSESEFKKMPQEVQDILEYTKDIQFIIPEHRMKDPIFASAIVGWLCAIGYSPDRIGTHYVRVAINIHNDAEYVVKDIGVQYEVFYNGESIGVCPKLEVNARKIILDHINPSITWDYCSDYEEE